MAKAIALVSALCIVALVATVAHAHNQVFNVEGDVYCDPCRVQFQTELSEKLPGNIYIHSATICWDSALCRLKKNKKHVIYLLRFDYAGATVRLECKNEVTKALSYSVEGVTDVNGKYSLQVHGDHQGDECIVRAIRSPRADCVEPLSEVDGARIVCTENIGIHSGVRYANPIGFMTKEGDPKCMSVLQDFFEDN